MRYLLLLPFLLLGCDESDPNTPVVIEAKYEEASEVSALELEKQQWVNSIYYYEQIDRDNSNFYARRDMQVHGHTVRLYTGLSRTEATMAKGRALKILED
jgi:hypothetical protein